MDLIQKLRDMIYPYKEESSIKKGGKNIFVVRNTRTGERIVVFNGFIYSRFPGKGIYTRSYWDFFVPFGCISSHPRVLMIGLGGGTIAYQIEHLFKNARLDIVEIDKDMIGIARRLYPEMKANVVLGDGLAYIKGKSNEYDAIIVDVYIDLDIPKGFLYDEFVDDLSKALKPKGVVGMNFAQTFKKAGEFSELSKKLGRLFNVYMINVSLMTDNTIIVCGKGIDREAIVERLREGMPDEKENRHILEGYKRMSAFR